MPKVKKALNVRGSRSFHKEPMTFDWETDKSFIHICAGALLELKTSLLTR